MAEITLTLETTPIEGLEEDMAAVKAELNKAVIQAATLVGHTMQDRLAESINRNVYRRYYPRVYLRRKNRPEFGIALNDMEHTTHATFDNPAAGSVGGALNFSYLPDGSNSATTADLDPYNDFYDADHPKSINPNPVEGDSLIRRIETGRGYATPFARRRPFWQKFVEQMIDGGEIEREFERGLTLAGQELLPDNSAVEREPQDGNY